MTDDKSLFHEHQLTVGRLADKLATMPRDLYVILAKDGEGNEFSPLAAGGVDLATYVPESTYHGYLDSGDYNEEEDEEGVGPDQPENPNCVVFWPIN